MVASWGTMLPWGVVLAKRRVHQWFVYHRNLQSIGWLLQLIGMIAIVLHVQESSGGGGGAVVIHFESLHGKIGLAVSSIGTLQPLNALMRPHPVNHVTGKRTKGRATWEIIHKTFGWLASNC